MGLKVSYVVPVYNEEEILPPRLKELTSLFESVKSIDIEFIFVDSNSQDKSAQLLKEFCNNHSTHKLVHNQEQPSSIGGAVDAGIQHSKGDVIVVLPLDCAIRFDQIGKFESDLLSLGVGEYCGFSKFYDKEDRLLKVSSLLQNFVRRKILKNLLWTNGFAIHRSLFTEDIIPKEGFLEDVILSDRLKLRGSFQDSDCHIIVDSRNYQKSSLNRTLKNLYILLLFRLKLRTPLQLRKLYRTQRIQ